jgi:hypothetical protein
MHLLVFELIYICMFKIKFDAYFVVLGLKFDVINVV